MYRIAAVVLTLLAGWAIAPSVMAAEPVYTNKPRFRIPFRFDSAEMQRLRPREVQLHVSNDRGLLWQHVQSADPNSGKFDYEAPADGEYWFAVKTLDVQNRIYPGANSEPGLKVHVDTTRPNLELRLREIERGKVQLTWYADDANLDPTTLRLEYMQTGTSSWQQVSIVPQASGQTTWSVPQGGFVAVRGSVGDLASNMGQNQSQINVGSSSSGDPDSEDNGPAEYREPVAKSKPQDDSFAPISEFDRTSPESQSPPGQRTPAVSSRTNTAPNTAKSGGTLISNAPQSRPQVLQQRRPGDPQPALKSPDVMRQFVNSRSFQVGYRIDGADSAAVAAVELYVTQDDGRQWSLYGEDRDRQSPFPVTVPSDGIYGFRLRVRSASGPSSERPKPGDKPTIVVTVDQTPPVAQLLPVQLVQDAAQSGVLIRWDVRDEHLGPNPIALSIAPQPNGPWTQLGDWQPNSGQFVWSPEPGTPAQAYLRLTAKDAAGNVTEIAPREAVMVSRDRPSVRIMGVEPRTTAPAKQ